MIMRLRCRLRFLRAGARQLLAQAVEIEVETISCHGEGFEAYGRARVVRHGYGPARTIATGIGPVRFLRYATRGEVLAVDR